MLKQNQDLRAATADATAAAAAAEAAACIFMCHNVLLFYSCPNNNNSSSSSRNDQKTTQVLEQLRRKIEKQLAALGKRKMQGGKTAYACQTKQVKLTLAKCKSQKGKGRDRGREGDSAIEDDGETKTESRQSESGN